jgi:hypothetical protein
VQETSRNKDDRGAHWKPWFITCLLWPNTVLWASHFVISTIRASLGRGQKLEAKEMREISASHHEDIQSSVSEAFI